MIRTTLLRVRTTGQLVRDQESLTNFAALWSARRVIIRHGTFEFKGSDAPLSWQMNQSQIEDIQTQWNDRIKGIDNQGWLQVDCFFRGHSSGCGHPEQHVNKGAW